MGWLSGAGYGILAAVICINISSIAYLWFPSTCTAKDERSRRGCIHPALDLSSPHARVNLHLYTLPRLSKRGGVHTDLLALHQRAVEPFASYWGISAHEDLKATVSVPLPAKARETGDVALVAVLTQASTAAAAAAAADSADSPDTQNSNSVAAIATPDLSRGDHDLSLLATRIPLTRKLPIRSRSRQFLLGGNDNDSSSSTNALVADDVSDDDDDDAVTGQPELKNDEITVSKEVTSTPPSQVSKSNSADWWNDAARTQEPWPHWKRQVKLRLVPDGRRFPGGGLARDLRWDVRVSSSRQHATYKPFFTIDELHLLRHHMAPLSPDSSRPDPPITLHFVPTSLGTFRLLTQLETSVNMLHSVGLTENETDELLMLMHPDRMFRMVITYAVSITHSVLSVLAFKNEVGFWRGRETLEGLSRRAVVGNAVGSVVVALFLLDSPGTSSIIVGTTCIQALIDLWKVSKMFRWGLSWRRGTSSNNKSAMTAAERQTDAYDAKGMYYLSLVLYPLVAGWAVYSLVYERYATFWSWFIHSAYRANMAFGFLLMTPQIFINYQLKSVSHLPWRALSYKVFLTFVDDIFAWVIDMPTIHRVMTLRDDVVFFIFLYQWWIYPVDMKRPNEFGYAFEKPEEDEKDEKGEGGEDAQQQESEIDHADDGASDDKEGPQTGSIDGDDDDDDDDDDNDGVDEMGDEQLARQDDNSTGMRRRKAVAS